MTHSLLATELANLAPSVDLARELDMMHISLMVASSMSEDFGQPQRTKPRFLPRSASCWATN